MVYKSTVIGIFSTAALVALIALSRQFSHTAEEKLVVTQVETIELSPPPSPPEITPPEEQPDDEPPPAPSLDLPSDLPSIDAPEITISLEKVPLALSIQVFNTDTAPSKVPTRSVKKTVSKARLKPKTKIKRKISVKRKPIARTKSHYSTSELDGKPRQRHTGSYKWPRGVKGISASVKLYMEISTSGHVKVISVISSTNSSLNTAAMKVASGSRFTPPLFRGRPVKARFYKTYTLKK